MAGGQDDVAVGRRDDAAVLHVRGDQVDAPPRGRADPTLVLDAGALAGGEEIELTAQELLVLEIQGGCQQTVHVHRRSRSEQDAVLVDQKDPAVTLQRAVDGRGVAAGDPVQHGTGGGLLDEAGKFSRVDGEAVPVDDGVGGVGYGKGVAGGRERDLATDHLIACGVGQRAPLKQGQQNDDRGAPLPQTCQNSRMPRVNIAYHGHTPYCSALGQTVALAFKRSNRQYMNMVLKCRAESPCLVVAPSLSAYPQSSEKEKFAPKERRSPVPMLVMA